MLFFISRSCGKGTCILPSDIFLACTWNFICVGTQYLEPLSLPSNYWHDPNVLDSCSRCTTQWDPVRDNQGEAEIQDIMHNDRILLTCYDAFIFLTFLSVTVLLIGSDLCFLMWYTQYLASHLAINVHELFILILLTLKIKDDLSDMIYLVFIYPPAVSIKSIKTSFDSGEVLVLLIFES